MTANPQTEPQKMSEAEYLAMEPEEGVRYEYIDGAIYAMSGGKTPHNFIINDMNTQMIVSLRNTPCDAAASEFRVLCPQSRNYYFPDIIAYCGAPDFVENTGLATMTNPVLLVEVLSPSTERSDRSGKWQDYQTIPTLMEYVLVTTHKPLVEQFVRQEGTLDVSWSYKTTAGLDKTITLPSLNITIPMTEIYRRVTFD